MLKKATSTKAIAPTGATPQPLGIVTTTNDTGAGGVGAVPTSAAATQSDKVWQLTIPAATVNGTVTTPGVYPLPQIASQFYIVEASAQITITQSPGGVENPFSTNQKLICEKDFSLLTIKNYNSFPVALTIFVGTNDFTSYQFTLQNSNLPQRAYSTSPTPQGSALIAIPDLSGQAFIDASGASRIAVSRVAILIGNVDSSALLYLQGGLTGSTNAGGIPIFAQQLIQINASGNFFLTLNNSTLVNATVTEIYLCTT